MTGRGAGRASLRKPSAAFRNLDGDAAADQTRRYEALCAHYGMAAFGQPTKLPTDQVTLARRLMEEATSARAVAKMLNGYAATLYRAMSAAEKAGASHTAG